MPCEWPVKDGDPVLSQSRVEVWCVELEAPWLELGALEVTLTVEELERASRYHFEKDRRRFILRRGILRTLLGRLMEVPPLAIQLVANEYGKPCLHPDHGVKLEFNLSTHADLALMAWALNRRVGIDIEEIRSDIDTKAIASRFFSRSEQYALHRLPADQRIIGFFNCWTRKEAFIKAYGHGLALPLDQFDVSVEPGEPARILATRFAPKEDGRWQMRYLEPAEGFVGALVVEGGDWQPDFRRLGQGNL